VKRRPDRGARKGAKGNGEGEGGHPGYSEPENGKKGTFKVLKPGKQDAARKAEPGKQDAAR